MKDLTPALFITKEGALAAARKVEAKTKAVNFYAHQRAVRDSKGWTATYINPSNFNARYVTNDDVERLQ